MSVCRLRPQYIFDVLGYDCLWTATFLQPDRLPFMNFSELPRALQCHAMSARLRNI